MATDFRRLNCSKGCCLEKVKHLTEQIFNEQDLMYNNLAEENIELGNFVVDHILPYLEARADSRDHKAQDLLSQLMHTLRGV
jgi:hypothetical protein